jgi:2-oxoglutarate ferredoxin oxidoreductase subunit gamma
MTMRYEIEMSGTGGQGTVLLGAILAEAVSNQEGLYVAQTQAYDPAVRGGKAESNLIISDTPIDWPGQLQADILLALSPEAYDRNISKLKDDGLLIVDQDLVKKAAWNKVLKIPFTHIARSKFNDERVVNTMGAGVLTGLCQYVPAEGVKKALAGNFKGKAFELNLAAFKEGSEWAARGLKDGFEKIEIVEEN